MSGGSLSRGVSVRETPTVKSGGYASYWNAFLFAGSLHVRVR